MTTIHSPGEEKKVEQVAFIKKLFSEKYNLQVSDIRTEPRIWNNYVHHVSLVSPVGECRCLEPDMPGVGMVAAGTTRMIVRFPNPEAILNQAVRIPNSVAAMTIGREALAGFTPCIVPVVYAWHADVNGSGWIIEEYMPGAGQRWITHHKSPENQRIILSQMADVLKAIQDFKLPATVQGYGGLGFDEQGNIVNRAMVVEPYNGPFPSVAAQYHGMLTSALSDCDRSPVSQGWQRNGLRDRINNFIAHGIDELISTAPSARPVLIHGDLHLGNFLFDPDTLRVTALLDFDFAHIAAPLHEYFFSFPDRDYVLQGPYASSQVERDIRNTLLHGYPSPLPPSKPPYDGPKRPGSEPNPQWELMQRWEGELERVQALRPSNIVGADEVSTLYSFMNDLCYWYFNDPRWLKSLSEEKLEKQRLEQEEMLDKYLSGWGY